MDFFVHAIRGILYLEPFVIANKIDLSKQILDATDALFNGEPIMLPVPEDAPQEFPRLILKSNDELYECILSNNRLELALKVKGDPDKSLGDFADTHREIMLKTASALINYLQSLVIPRAASVIDFFSYLESSANAYIRDSFFKPNTLTNSKEIQFNTLYQSTVSGLDVNQWIRISALRRVEDLDRDDALLTQVDINTLHEVNHNFSIESLNRFFQDLTPFIDDTLTGHFQS